ncbi:MAG: methyltransferase domain-containing protein [Clostridiales bacterium]|nr:methyltransferase domain-containing protein [Clostridiales bacterium]
MKLVKENSEVIKAYYDSNPLLEWERTNENQIEYIITTKMLSRYISPEESVLDIGGGPGRYSTWLASRGCDVTQIDLSEGNIDLAKTKAKEHNLSIKTICGNALDEGLYPDKKYDHILVMGPMYHLFKYEDRKRVIDNALLHLKKGGKIYIAFINLFAGLLYYLDDDKYGFKQQHDIDTSYGHCLLENIGWNGKAFTEARFEAIPEIKRFCNSFGLRQINLFGQEGFLGPFIHQFDNIEEPHRSLYIDYAYRMCDMEDHLIMSAHIMYIGEK